MSAYEHADERRVFDEDPCDRAPLESSCSEAGVPERPCHANEPSDPRDREPQGRPRRREREHDECAERGERRAQHRRRVHELPELLAPDDEEGGNGSGADRRADCEAVHRADGEARDHQDRVGDERSSEHQHGGPEPADRLEVRGDEIQGADEDAGADRDRQERPDVVILAAEQHVQQRRRCGGHDERPGDGQVEVEAQVRSRDVLR